MEGTSVSEIHHYPLRPAGFEEPLFRTPGSRRAVAEHLLCAPWLRRASEVERPCRGGQTVHVSEEKVEVEHRQGSVHVVRRLGGQRRRCGERRVVGTLSRWRDVGGWWSDEETRDRVVVRVLLSDGAIVDLAREDGAWSLVGIVD